MMQLLSSISASFHVIEWPVSPVVFVQLSGCWRWKRKCGILSECKKFLPALFMPTMHNAHLQISLSPFLFFNIFLETFGDCVEPQRQNLLWVSCLCLALLPCPVSAHNQDASFTMLDFSPYRLIPTHPGAAIKPDPGMHIDQCSSSWFPPHLSLGKMGSTVSLSLSLC